MKKFFVGLLSIFMIFGASLLSACGGGTPQLNVYYNGKAIEKVVEIELNPQDQDSGYILLSADITGADDPTITASPASGSEDIFTVEPAGKSNGKEYFKVIADRETTNGPAAVRFHGQPGDLVEYVYINVYSNVASMSQNAYESRNQFLVDNNTYLVDENGISHVPEEGQKQINVMTENQLIEFKPSQNSRRNLSWEIELHDKSGFLGISSGSSFTVNENVIQTDAEGKKVVVLRATDEINHAQTTISLTVLDEIAGEVNMRWNRTANSSEGEIPGTENQEIISNIATDPNYQGYCWVQYTGDELQIVPVAYRKTVVGTEVVWERLYSEKENRAGISSELYLENHLRVLSIPGSSEFSGFSVSTASATNIQEYKLTFQVGYAQYNYYGTTNPVFLDLKEKVNRVFVSTRNNHEMEGDLTDKTTIDIYNNYATVKGVSRKEHGQLFKVLLSPDAENGAQQLYNVSFTMPIDVTYTDDTKCDLDICGREGVACPFHLYYMAPNGAIRLLETELDTTTPRMDVWHSKAPIAESGELYIIASSQLAGQSVDGVVAKFVSVDNDKAYTSFMVNLKKSASQNNFDEIKELQLKADGGLAVETDPHSPDYGKYLEAEKIGFVRIDSSKVGEKHTKAFRLEGQSNIDGLYLDYIDEDITIENIKMLVSDSENNFVIFTVDFSLKASAYGKTTQVAYAIKHENGGYTTSDPTAGNEKFVVNIALPFTGYSIYPDMGNNLSNSITDVSYKGSDVASLMLKNSTLTPILLSMPSTNGYVPKISEATVEYLDFEDAGLSLETFLQLNNSSEEFIDVVNAKGLTLKTDSTVAYFDTGKIKKDLTASISTRGSGYTYVVLTLKGTDLEGKDKSISKVILVESYVAPDGLTIKPAANRELSLYASDSVSSEYSSLTYKDISIVFDNSNVTYHEMDKYKDLLVVSSKHHAGDDEYKKYYSIEGLSLTQSGISFKITALSTDGMAQVGDVIDIVYQIKKDNRVVYKIQTSIVITINNAQRIEKVSWKNYDAQGLYYEIGSTDTNRLVLLETTPTNAKDNSMYCLITDSVGNSRTDVFKSSDEVATGMFSFNLDDVFTRDDAKGMSGKIYILPQDAVNGGILKYYIMTDASGEKIPFSEIESASVKNESTVQTLSSLDIGKNYEELVSYGYFKSTTEEGTKLVSLADIILSIDLEIADGSEENPFRVFTAEQFEDMKSNLHYVVMNDIDLTSTSYMPIDYYYDSSLGRYVKTLFTGGLKGYNPDGSTTITLKTNVIVEEIEEGAYIKNLTFAGNVSARGFVANTNEGTIDGVTVDTNGLQASVLRGSDVTGGIVGENKGVITNSAVLGLQINNANTVGGIAGKNSGEISNSKVEFYNLATVVVDGVATATATNSFDGSKVGGIVGQMTGGKIYRTYVYDYTLTESHQANGLTQPFVGENAGFSGELDYVFAVVGLDTTVVTVKNNNYYLGYYNVSDNYTINNTNSDAFTLNAQISANFVCPTLENGSENGEFDSSINDGQPYFKDFYQPKGLSASEIADVRVRDFAENNFYKSINVSANEGLIFFYQLTIDEETLSSSEKIDYTQMNTIDLADLLGFNKSITNVIVTSSNNRIVRPMGSSILVLSTGKVDITITAKQDVTVNKTISLNVVNSLTNLVLSRVGQDGKTIVIDDNNVVAIQKTTSKDVQVAQRTTSIYLGSLAALHNLAQPQWQINTATEAVTGSLTEVEKVSAIASASFVSLVTTAQTSTEVGTKVQIYPQMTGLTVLEQNAIKRIFNRQFVAQASDGVIFFEISGEEFPLSPSTKAVVKTRIETTFVNDTILPVVVYNGRAMQVESSGSNFTFKDVLGNNVLFVTVGNKQELDNSNPYIYVYDVTFSVHPDYQRKVAENMKFQVYFTSESGNSSLVWGGQFDLVLSRQGFTNVDTSFVKVYGTYIDGQREVFRTDGQVSTLAPGNAAILKVTVNPEFAYYDYAKISFSGASVANPVVLDAVEVFDLNAGKFATLLTSTATTEREGTSLRYYPKAVSDRLYFKVWINTTVERDTTMKFTVAFYKNGQSEPLDYVNSYLEISYLAEPKVTINGEEIAFIAKGTTNEVEIQVREDQTVDSVDLEGDFGLEGVSLSSLSLPTIDSTKGIKTYVATLRCFVDAKSDTKNRFYITATVSRTLNGEKESKKTTATAVIVDFKIDDVVIENANNSQFLAWQNISKRFGVTYNLLPEAYSSGEANQDMIDQLIANKDFFKNNHYYPKAISSADPNAPEYYINWLQDKETKEWKRQSTLDRLFVRSGGNDVHYANVDLPFSFTEDRDTGLVQIKGSSINTPPITMVLYTYVYAGGVQTVIETEFVVSVVAFSDPDLPLSIKSAADFLKLDPSRKQEGAVEGEENNRAPQDYILENDIVLENYIPFSTNLIRSLDGNGYTIYLKSFDLETPNNLKLALFDEVSDELVVSEVNSATQTTLKNLRVNYYNGGQITVDISRHSSVNVAGIAITNSGIITNCEVVSFYETTLVGETITDVEPVLPCIQHTKTQGFNIAYRNGANTTENVSLADNSGWSTSVAGFVLTNDGSITNSRVGGDEVIMIDSVGVQNDIQTFAHTQTLGKFSIIAQGNIAGFVGTNNGNIASSFAKNIEIKNSSAATKYWTAGFVGVNNEEAAVITSYAEGVKSPDTTNSAYLYANIGSTISSNMGFISGFTYENKGEIKDSYSNILIANSTTTDRVYLASGFVYTNQGMLENCYSAAQVANANYSQMNFSGVNTNGQLLANGTYENCYFYSAELYVEEKEDVYDDTTESQYKTGAKLIANPSIESSFYGFAIAETEQFFKDGIWKCSLEEGIRLIEPDYIAKSHRYKSFLPSTGDGDNEEYVLPYATLIVDGNTTYDTALGGKHNPILIADAEDWQEISGTSLSSYVQMTFDENEIFGVYRVVNDIDFSVLKEELISTYKNFTGALYGNGFQLSNISLSQTNEEILEKGTLSFGLFSTMSGPIVDKLKSEKPTLVLNVDMQINQVTAGLAPSVGGLAGIARGATLINIEIAFSEEQDSVIEGLNFAGGLVGFAYDENKIKNIVVKNPNVIADTFTEGDRDNFIKNLSSFRGEVRNNVATALTSTAKDYSYAGSVVGYIDNYKANEHADDAFVAETKDAEVIYDINFIRVEGTVQVKAQVVGGVFGLSGYNTKVNDAVVTITVKEGKASRIISTRYFAGGLVGQAYGRFSRVYTVHDADTQKQIEDNMGSYYASNNKSAQRGALDLFDTTNIDLDNKQIAVGGLFGYVGSGLLEVSYSKLNVTSMSSQYAGGLIGMMDVGLAETYTATADALYNTNEETRYFINEVFATGDVRASVMAGGLIGAIKGNNSKIKVLAANAVNYISTYDYATGGEVTIDPNQFEISSALKVNSFVGQFIKVDKDTGVETVEKFVSRGTEERVEDSTVEFLDGGNVASYIEFTEATDSVLNTGEALPSTARFRYYMFGKDEKAQKLYLKRFGEPFATDTAYTDGVDSTKDDHADENNSINSQGYAIYYNYAEDMTDERHYIKQAETPAYFADSATGKSYTQSVFLNSGVWSYQNWGHPIDSLFPVIRSTETLDMSYIDLYNAAQVFEHMNNEGSGSTVIVRGLKSANLDIEDPASFSHIEIARSDTDGMFYIANNGLGDVEKNQFHAIGSLRAFTGRIIGGRYPETSLVKTQIISNTNFISQLGEGATIVDQEFVFVKALPEGSTKDASTHPKTDVDLSVQAGLNGVGMFVRNELVKVTLTNLTLSFRNEVTITGHKFLGKETNGYEQNFGLIAPAIVSSDIENLTINNAIANAGSSLLGIGELTQELKADGTLKQFEDETQAPDAQGKRALIDPYINVGTIAGKLINTSADDAMIIKGLAVSKKSSSTGMISVNAPGTSAQNINIGGYFGKITKAYEGSSQFLAEFAAPSWQGSYTRIYVGANAGNKNLNIGGFVGHLQSCDGLSTPESKSLTSKIAYGLDGEYTALNVGNVIGLNQNKSTTTLKGSVNDSADISMVIAATDSWENDGFLLDDESGNTNDKFKTIYDSKPVIARNVAIGGIIGRQEKITAITNFAKVDIKANLEGSGGPQVIAGYVGYSSSSLSIVNSVQSVVTGYIKSKNGKDALASSVLAYTDMAGGSFVFEGDVLSTLDVDFCDVASGHCAVFGSILGGINSSSENTAIKIQINATAINKMIAYNGTIIGDKVNDLRFGGVIGNIALATTNSVVDEIRITGGSSKNSFGGKVLVRNGGSSVATGGSIGVIKNTKPEDIIELRNSYNYGDVFIDYSETFTALTNYRFGGLIAEVDEAKYLVYTNFSAMTSHNARYLQSSDTAHALIGKGMPTTDGQVLNENLYNSINYDDNHVTGVNWWNNNYSHAVCLLNDSKANGSDIGYNTGYYDTSYRKGYDRANYDSQDCDIVQRILYGLGVYSAYNSVNNTPNFNGIGNPFPVGHKLNPVVISSNVDSTFILGTSAGSNGDLGKHYYAGTSHEMTDKISGTITYQDKLDSLVGVGAYNFTEDLVYYTLGNDITVTANKDDVTSGCFLYSRPAAFIGDAFQINFDNTNPKVHALFHGYYSTIENQAIKFSFISSLVEEVDMQIQNADREFLRYSSSYTSNRPKYAALVVDMFRQNASRVHTDGEETIIYAVNAHGKMDIGGSLMTDIGAFVFDTEGRISDCSADIDIVDRTGTEIAAGSGWDGTISNIKGFAQVIRAGAIIENSYSMGSIQTLSGGRIAPFTNYNVTLAIENSYSATRIDWKDYINIKDFDDLTATTDGSYQVWKLGTAEKIVRNTANYIDTDTTAIGYSGASAFNYTNRDYSSTNGWFNKLKNETSVKDKVHESVWTSDYRYNYFYPTLKYQYLKTSSYATQTQVACDCGHIHTGDTKCTTPTYDCYIDNYSYTRMKNGKTDPNEGDNINGSFYMITSAAALAYRLATSDAAEAVIMYDMDLSKSSTGSNFANKLNTLTFSGKIEGQGHTIKGLTTNLFDKITNGAYIKNLRLTDVNINNTALAATTDYFGIVANEIEDATISNMTLSGNLKYKFTSGDQPAIGSVAGRYDRTNSGESTVYYLSNIQSTVNITVDCNNAINWVDVGGIVGEANGSGSADNTKDSSNIYYCSNYGNINVYGKTTGPAKDHTAGGIVAYAKNVYIKHSYNAAAIWNGYDNGTASLKNGQGGTDDVLPGSFKTAGIAATIGNGTKSNIVGCYNTGMIKSGNKTASTIDGVKSHAGGITAFLESDTTSGNINSCYNEGSVEALAKNGTYKYKWDNETSPTKLQIYQETDQNVWVYGIGPDAGNTNIYKVEQDETGRTSILGNGSSVETGGVVHEIAYANNDVRNKWGKDYQLDSTSTTNKNLYEYTAKNHRYGDNNAKTSVGFTYKPNPEVDATSKPFDFSAASVNFLNLPTALKYSMEYALVLAVKSYDDGSQKFHASASTTVTEQFIKGINDLTYSKDGVNILTSHFNATMQGQAATQVFVNYTTETSSAALVAESGKQAADIIAETRTQITDGKGSSYLELDIADQKVYLVKNGSKSIFTAGLKTASDTQFEFTDVVFDATAVYSISLSDGGGPVSFAGANYAKAAGGNHVIATVASIYSNSEELNITATLNTIYSETQGYTFTSNMYVVGGKIGLGCSNYTTLINYKTAWDTSGSYYKALVNGQQVLLTDNGNDFIFDPSVNTSVELKDLEGQAITFVNITGAGEMIFSNDISVLAQSITNLEKTKNLIDEKSGTYITFDEADMLIEGGKTKGYFTGGAWSADVAVTSFAEEYLQFNTNVDKIREIKEEIRYSTDMIGAGNSLSVLLDVPTGYSIDSDSIEVSSDAGDVTADTTIVLSGANLTITNNSDSSMNAITVNYNVYKEYTSQISGNRIKKSDFDAISGTKTYYYNGSKINSTVNQSSVYKIKSGYQIVRSSEATFTENTKTITFGSYSVTFNISRSVQYESLKYNNSYEINQTAYYSYEFTIADNTYPTDRIYSLLMTGDGSGFIYSANGKFDQNYYNYSFYVDNDAWSTTSSDRLKNAADTKYDIGLEYSIHATYCFDTVTADGLIDEQNDFFVEAYFDSQNNGKEEESEPRFKFTKKLVEDSAVVYEQKYMKNAGWYEEKNSSTKDYYLFKYSQSGETYTLSSIENVGNNLSDTGKAYVWFDRVYDEGDELQDDNEYVALTTISVANWYDSQGALKTGNIPIGTTFTPSVDFSLGTGELAAKGIHTTKHYNENTFTEMSPSGGLLSVGSMVALPKGYRAESSSETGLTSSITRKPASTSTFTAAAKKQVTLASDKGGTIDPTSIRVQSIQYYGVDGTTISVYAVAQNGASRNGKQLGTVDFESTKTMSLAPTKIGFDGSTINTEVKSIVMQQDIDITEIPSASELLLPIIGNGYNISFYGASLFNKSSKRVQDVNFLGEVNVLQTTQSNVSGYFNFDDEDSSIILDNIGYYGNIHLRPRLFRTKDFTNISNFCSSVSTDMSLKYFDDSDNVVNLINVPSGAAQSSLNYINNMKIISRNQEDQYIFRNGGNLIFVNKGDSETVKEEVYFNKTLEYLTINCCDKVSGPTKIVGESKSHMRSAVNVNVGNTYNNDIQDSQRTETGWTNVSGDFTDETAVSVSCRTQFKIKKASFGDGSDHMWASDHYSGWSLLTSPFYTMYVRECNFYWDTGSGDVKSGVTVVGDLDVFRHPCIDYDTSPGDKKDGHWFEAHWIWITAHTDAYKWLCWTSLAGLGSGNTSNLLSKFLGNSTAYPFTENPGTSII